MEGLVLMGGGGGVWRELAYRRALAHDQVFLRDLALFRPDLAHEFLDRCSLDFYFKVCLCVRVFLCACVLLLYDEGWI